MEIIFDKPVPTELPELVEPRSTALLIIDMQNDFCSPGGTADRAGADLSMYGEVIRQTAAFADICRSNGVRVFHARMNTLPNGASDSAAWLRMRMRANKGYRVANAGLWSYTLEGSWGAEFVPELTPGEGDLVVTKYRSTAFKNTNLDLLLRSNGISTVLVAGCTTEGCVESTVRDLGFHDYFAVVLSDCVASDVRELHEASMILMRAYRADVVESAEVLRVWEDASLG